MPTYDIDAPETLRCTVPRAAVVGRQTIVAAQQIEIKPESGTGSMSGRWHLDPYPRPKPNPKPNPITQPSRHRQDVG